MWKKYAQILYNSISKICPKWAQATDSMGRIQTAHLLCTRITPETTALRIIWKLRSRRTGVFPEVQVCVFECFWGPKKVFQIHEKSWFFTTHGSKKKRSWAKPFERTVLGSYFMKINDILTKWILKTYSMWEKCVQILYRSINNSKIYLKCTKTIDWMVGFGWHISSAPVLL